MKSHEEFIELCALSTSGELDARERKRLAEHLAGCSECRDVLRQFQELAEAGMPMLFQHSQPQSTPALAEGNRRGLIPRDTGTQWSVAWIPFAALVLLTIALAVYTYQLGRRSEVNVARLAAEAADVKAAALEAKVNGAARDQEHLKRQVLKRDRTISELHLQVTTQSAALVRLRGSQAKLKHMIQIDQGTNRDAAMLNAKLRKDLGATQRSLSKAETELQSIRRQQAETRQQVLDLNTQTAMLTAQLREEDATVEQQAELLSHDRDIRELMGARDLYIAEVYDVARNGATRKPFGRVFYTKQKSLVFYAYDLEQQTGAKASSEFQVWGRGEGGKDLSLGIFYQDNAAKKRWVLKCDNPKELSEIDAVFVTVEPKGGSATPTGKPLLFASLKIDPNHP